MGGADARRDGVAPGRCDERAGVAALEDEVLAGRAVGRLLPCGGDLLLADVEAEPAGSRPLGDPQQELAPAAADVERAIGRFEREQADQRVHLLRPDRVVETEARRGRSGSPSRA